MGLIEKLDDLNGEYYRRFSELQENFDLLPAAQYKAMCEALTKQYERDYKLLEGADGINADNEIEQLKIERTKKLEAIRLEHDKLTEEINTQRTEQLEAIKLERDKLIEELNTERTRELEELKLERARLDAEIAEKRYKIKCEKELLEKFYDAEYEEKAARVVPADLPKRWWQRWARPNEAKKLVLKAASLDIYNYYDERKTELARMQTERTGTENYIAGLLYSLPAPRSRRAREKWYDELDAIAHELQRIMPGMTIDIVNDEEPELEADELEEEQAETAAPTRGELREQKRLEKQLRKEARARQRAKKKKGEGIDGEPTDEPQSGEETPGNAETQE